MDLIPLYGGCFSPPGLHHRKIARRIVSAFGRVVIRPCGIREDKDSSWAISRMDRKDLVGLNFSGLKGVEICYDDLDDDIFTPTWRLEEIYHQRGDVHHVIGPDLVEGGARGRSEMQMSWQRGGYIWQNLNFVIIVPQNASLRTEDLPPHSTVIPMGPLNGRSKSIRSAIAEGKPFRHMLFSSVAQAIEGRCLYGYKIQ